VASPSDRRGREGAKHTRRTHGRVLRQRTSGSLAARGRAARRRRVGELRHHQSCRRRVGATAHGAAHRSRTAARPYAIFVRILRLAPLGSTLIGQSSRHQSHLHARRWGADPRCPRHVERDDRALDEPTRARSCASPVLRASQVQLRSTPGARAGSADTALAAELALVVLSVRRRCTPRRRGGYRSSSGEVLTGRGGGQAAHRVRPICSTRTRALSDGRIGWSFQLLRGWCTRQGTVTVTPRSTARRWRGTNESADDSALAKRRVRRADSSELRAALANRAVAAARVLKRFEGPSTSGASSD
jgi:hypothetical protein